MERNVLIKKIQGDLNEAVKARDKLRISTLRMILSSLKNSELDEREELTEEKEMAVLTSYMRRVKESIKEFEKGNREDLVAKEKSELEIVMSYLPEQLGEDAILDESKKVIAELGASGPRDTGRVMSTMMNRFKGRVDGKTVSSIVSDLLREG